MTNGFARARGGMVVGALVSSVSLAGAASSAPQAVATPRVTVGISGAGVQAQVSGATATLAVASGPPNFGVPVEVRAITDDTRQPQAVIVNVGSRDIHVVELAVYRPGRDGLWELVGSSGQFGIEGWGPGVERRSSAAGWRPDDGSVLVPTMAFFDDGTAVGRPETIEGARSESRSSLAALDALHQAFDAFPDPVGGDQVQALIDHIALAFARVPYTPEGRANHEFLRTIAELKRLTSSARPTGLSIEDGVAQARQRVANALDMQRRLPVLRKDSSPKTGTGVP